MKTTRIPIDHKAFLMAAVGATSTKAVRELLGTLPIVPDAEYAFDESDPGKGWQDDRLHWYPVGADLGNQGRIKLGGEPDPPIAERTINGIEAVLELHRRRELLKNPHASPPQSPREAALRYFDLPPLDLLPKMQADGITIRGKLPRAYASDLAANVKLRLIRSMKPVEYTVVIEDAGMGQSPLTAHKSFLSLGQSDKGDKPYLIGVFGQGGSSTFAASEYSWIISRRAPDLGDDPGHEVAWTVVRKIVRPGRQQIHWAYLAAAHDGRVPALSAAAADAVGFGHGTRFAHLNYNFGKTEPARALYQTLQHLLFKPVLPYELYTGPDRSRDLMWGNGYRLSLLSKDKKELDKPFPNQAVEKKVEEV